MSDTYRPALVPAGHAIMHGKLVFNHSLSTVLSLKRFSTLGLSRPEDVLLRKREIRGCRACHGDGLGLRLEALVPRGKRVAAVGNVGDLEIPRLVGFRIKRSGGDDDVTRHLRVHVAQQRNDSGHLELKRPLLAGWPGSQVVAQFFIAANGGPEDIVLYLIAVEKFHGSTDGRNQEVRLEQERFLVHIQWFCRSGERLPRTPRKYPSPRPLSR